MHTIIIVSEGGRANEKLEKQVRMLFPECRIKIIPKEANHADETAEGWSHIGTILKTKN